jgi:CheY-like chemotaxis protein/HPt (histidine-containing phosphotransfer) domain-containing protein
MAATAVKKSHTSPTAAISKRADGTPRRVLYAEDQVSSRVVTKAMLERMGFEVEAVDDGEVAVERARTEDFDLVLLDIEMPVMDGVTAARMIRAEVAQYKNTPILALSAFLADSTENCAWREAFDTAVPKPANSNELQRAMARAIAMHGAAPVVEETVAENTLIWSTMRRELPRGMRVILAKTAASEMEHLVLVMSAAVEAGDTETLSKARHGLKGLAANFGLQMIQDQVALTKESPDSLKPAVLLQGIATWLAAQKR